MKTGSIPGGSSDSNVFVKLYGEKGDTSKTMLVVSANNLGNYFESGRVDIFTVETFDIGQVLSLNVDSTKSRSPNMSDYAVKILSNVLIFSYIGFKCETAFICLICLFFGDFSEIMSGIYPICQIYAM